MSGASGGDLDNSGRIEGGSDGTIIGNVADRLKVDFSASPSGSEPIVPADEISYFVKFLLNGGSANLNVNGATTPVEFSSGPGGSENWYITEIIMILQDGGNLNATDYGAITNGLTNGLLVEHSRNATDYEITNVKYNYQIAMSFSHQAIQGSSQGFLNDSNLFVGAIKIEPEISLLGATSDVLKVTVQDNLTALTLHQIAYRAWKVL